MIESTTTDGVAVLAMRHGTVNALDTELCQALCGALDEAAAGQHHRGGAPGRLIQRAAQRLAQLGIQRVDRAVPHGQHRHAVRRGGFDHRWPPLRSWHQLPAEDLRRISPAQPSSKNPCRVTVVPG